MSKNHVLIFITAILLGYGGDIAPRYASIFFGDDVKVLGALSNFSVPCVQPKRGEVKCRNEYRIPRELVPPSAESVGLGVIVHPIEVLCGGSALIKEVDTAGPVSQFLHNYQTADLSFRCEDEIVVRNWVPDKFRRSGYAQGPVIVGSKPAVQKIKKLIEA